MDEKKVVMLILLAGFFISMVAFAKEATITAKVVHEENTAPVWKGHDSFKIQQKLRINLDRSFYDAEGDTMNYEATPAEGIYVEIRDKELIITAGKFYGMEIVSIFASDGKELTRKPIKIQR